MGIGPSTGAQCPPVGPSPEKGSPRQQASFPYTHQQLIVKGSHVSVRLGRVLDGLHGVNQNQVSLELGPDVIAHSCDGVGLTHPYKDKQ